MKDAKDLVLLSILARSRSYVLTAHKTAQSLYGNKENEFYNNDIMKKVMEDTKSLIILIDNYVKDNDLVKLKGDN